MFRERSHREVPLLDSFWEWIRKGKFFGSADTLAHLSLSDLSFAQTTPALPSVQRAEEESGIFASEDKTGLRVVFFLQSLAEILKVAFVS